MKDFLEDRKQTNMIGGGTKIFKKFLEIDYGFGPFLFFHNGAWKLMEFIGQKNIDLIFKLFSQFFLGKRKFNDFYFLNVLFRKLIKFINKFIRL